MSDETATLIESRYTALDFDALSKEELLLTMMRWTKCNIQSIDDTTFPIMEKMIGIQHINVLDDLVGIYLRGEACPVTALELLKLNYVAAQVILEDLDSQPEVGEPTLDNLSTLVREFNTAFSLYSVGYHGQN